ncbi:translation initiation factor IF-2-like [Motacilla alba alba]|uniref:translation initiation factor IF-2-like n=1 Tax=Motacilla alba alba TaxID=1094192 RepID=UPI0018D56C3A|nr:translation initiation factor IF-2-like [Motacilla alba alba]XP_037993172.1 translation initiation factor IF-2-like [Motacilla alba alba]XP_037993173.1 translation initiation factor IF-2-like [Motacilla alba alba]XP_037993174.1 translation initiation factor IF-2-like [Motacilla alba alba]XP_037993175.1 translation initiation factor IF-2-like [Motacilla alba alba]
MTPTLPVTRTPSPCPQPVPRVPSPPRVKVLCLPLSVCGRAAVPRAHAGHTSGTARGTGPGVGPAPARPPAQALAPERGPAGHGARGTATPSRPRRSLTLGAGAAGSAAGRGDGPRPASDRGAGREGGGLPFGVGRVNICRKPGRLFHLAEAQGFGEGAWVRRAARGCPGKGAKSGARCARSPLDCRIRYPAAAAVSHPRPRQRQPRRGVGSQTSRGAEPPLSSDEPGGAASASRVRARREPRLCRRGGVRHPCGGDGGDGAGGGSGGGQPLGGRAGEKYRCKIRTWVNERR